MGRTVHEFLSGAIFIFFKHPFDVGDRINVFNAADAPIASVIVKRISLLYVVCERVDDGTEAQFPNIQLCLRRIDNLTRSGQNRQQVALEIDFGTPFKDIQLLRGELQSFLTQRENARDYMSELGLTVASIRDMSRMELQCTVMHKSNWSDENLRAYRASRFLCAVIAAIRRVPIAKPGGGPKTGDEACPGYQVVVTEAEAAQKRKEQTQKKREKRMDYVAPTDQSGTAVSTPIEAAVTAAVDALDKEEDAEAKAQREQEEEEKRQQEREEAAALDSFMEIPLERRPSAGLGRHLMDDGGVGTAGQSSALSGFPFIAKNEVGARRSPRSISNPGLMAQQEDDSNDWRYGVAL